MGCYSPSQTGLENAGQVTRKARNFGTPVDDSEA